MANCYIPLSYSKWGSPHNMKYITPPTAYISELFEHRPNWSTSGAMSPGVPYRHTLVALPNRASWRANPKSATFMSELGLSSSKRMLSGFRSLCNNPAKTKDLTSEECSVTAAPCLSLTLFARSCYRPALCCVCRLFAGW